MKRIKYFSYALLWFLLLGGGIFAQQDNLQGYENVRLVRISYLTGDAFVERSYEQGAEEVIENLPVFENDRLFTDRGMVEIYLNRLNYLRIGQFSEVIFKKLPRTGDSELVLFLKKGSIYLDLRSINSDQNFEVQTTDCGFFAQQQGVYRIERNSKTELFCLEGYAEVAGSRESVYLRAGQTISARQGNFVGRISYYYSQHDELADFQRQRSELVSRNRFYRGRYLDNNYQDYEYELNQNGRWVYNYEVRNYVWVPYHLNYNWRPYYNGRWIWHPYYGYIWVSYDRWGWFNHYYGRWYWDPFYGWCWVPGYRWRGGWVNWYYYGGYYAWCPLDWWGRPIIIINNYWYRNYDWRRHGFPHNSRSTIVIRKDQLRAPRISEVAVDPARIAISKAELRPLENGPEAAVVSRGYLVRSSDNQQIVLKEGSVVKNRGNLQPVDIAIKSSNKNENREIDLAPAFRNRSNEKSDGIFREKESIQEKETSSSAAFGKRSGQQEKERDQEQNKSFDALRKKKDKQDEGYLSPDNAKADSRDEQGEQQTGAAFRSRSFRQQDSTEEKYLQPEKRQFDDDSSQALFRRRGNESTESEVKSESDENKSSDSSRSVFGRIFRDRSSSNSSSSDYRSSNSDNSNSSSVIRRSDSSSSGRSSFGGSSSSATSSSSSSSSKSNSNSGSAAIKKKDGR